MLVFDGRVVSLRVVSYVVSFSFMLVFDGRVVSLRVVSYVVSFSFMLVFDGRVVSLRVVSYVVSLGFRFVWLVVYGSMNHYLAITIYFLFHPLRKLVQYVCLRL
jgi:hypothetical protein